MEYIYWQSGLTDKHNLSEKDCFVTLLLSLDMCLLNIDAPGKHKVKYGKISKSYILTPPQGACDVSEVWAKLRSIYNRSLVTESPPKL